MVCSVRGVEETGFVKEQRTMVLSMGVRINLLMDAWVLVGVDRVSLLLAATVLVAVALEATVWKALVLKGAARETKRLHVTLHIGVEKVQVLIQMTDHISTVKFNHSSYHSKRYNVTCTCIRK